MTPVKRGISKVQVSSTQGFESVGSPFVFFVMSRRTLLSGLQDLELERRLSKKAAISQPRTLYPTSSKGLGSERCMRLLFYHEEIKLLSAENERNRKRRESGRMFG